MNDDLTARVDRLEREGGRWRVLALSLAVVGILRLALDGTAAPRPSTWGRR